MTNLQLLTELRALTQKTYDDFTLLAGKLNLIEHSLTQLRSRQADQDDQIVKLIAKVDQFSAGLDDHADRVDVRG